MDTDLSARTWEGNSGHWSLDTVTSDAALARASAEILSVAPAPFLAQHSESSSSSDPSRPAAEDSDQQLFLGPETVKVLTSLCYGRHCGAVCTEEVRTSLVAVVTRVRPDLTRRITMVRRANAALHLWETRDVYKTRDKRAMQALAEDLLCGWAERGDEKRDSADVADLLKIHASADTVSQNLAEALCLSMLLSDPSDDQGIPDSVRLLAALCVGDSGLPSIPALWVLNRALSWSFDVEDLYGLFLSTALSTLGDSTEAKELKRSDCLGLVNGMDRKQGVELCRILASPKFIRDVALRCCLGASDDGSEKLQTGGKVGLAYGDEAFRMLLGAKLIDLILSYSSMKETASLNTSDDESKDQVNGVTWDSLLPCLQLLIWSVQDQPSITSVSSAFPATCRFVDNTRVWSAPFLLLFIFVRPVLALFPLYTNSNVSIIRILRLRQIPLSEPTFLGCFISAWRCGRLAVTLSKNGYADRQGRL